MGKIVLFGNLKGGVGKTTNTSLIANYIHFETEKSVIVIDSDNQQDSIYDMRKNDIANGYDEKDLYDVVKVNSKDLLTQIEIIKDEYDYVMIDLPGNIEQEGVLTIYTLADYIFIPSRAGVLDLKSSLKFIELIKSSINPKRIELGHEPVIAMQFLSIVDTRLKETKEFLNSKENWPIPVMENVIPRLEAVFLRNPTTAQVYNKIDNSSLINFAKEVIELIK